MTRIAVDVRMINASGIGTYLQNILPIIVQSHPHYQFTFIGDREELQKLEWTRQNRIQIAHCDAPIYSISEQIKLPLRVPSGTKLLWVPHYNIPLMYRGRLLVTVHDLLHRAMPQMASGFFKQAYAKYMFQQVVNKANAINTISHFTKSELLKFTQNAESEKIHVIPLGVSEQWFNISKTAAPHPKPYLICVGNVKPHKNISRLIQAFGMLIDRIPHDLIIIGKRDGFLTGDHQAAEMAKLLGDRIRFTGFIDETTLHQFFAHADVLVFPSLYEGFGLPPLEAMACGCPVIASRAASIPEVCEDAVVYLDPLDPMDMAAQIESLIQDKGHRLRLSQQGRKHAARFPWEKCARMIGEIMEEVVSL